MSAHRRLLGPARRVRQAARQRVERTWAQRPGLARRVLPWTERARAVRARLRPHRPQRPLEQVVAAYARAVPDATFVQVGAHDGTQLDPLREAILGSRWRGIMVEPVPYVFERLAARYHANPRVILENVAVADADGTRPFHHLAQARPGERVWRWYDALGSFDRDVVLRHAELVEDLEARLVTTEVPCVTVDTLVGRHGLDRVNVVQVDTEGWDRRVLDLVDLDRLGVEVVVFEHLHLSPDDRAACRARLERHGFEQASDGMDTVAVSPKAMERPGVRAAFDAARAALTGFEQ